MNKHITAVVAESGAYHDLEIAPGTTTRDIRNQLHLDEHYLISKRGGDPFGEDENIYGTVADGEKLFVSTPVEVGVEKFSAQSHLFKCDEGQSLGLRFPQSIFSRRILGTIPAPIKNLKSPTVVQRDSRPYWEQRGWTSHGNEFRGYYRTPFGSWQGKASVSPSGRVELFIQHPPDALKMSEHWPCFRWRFGGWYFIHTNEPIADLSSGILEVEKIVIGAHSQ